MPTALRANLYRNVRLAVALLIAAACEIEKGSPSPETVTSSPAGTRRGWGGPPAAAAMGEKSGTFTTRSGAGLGCAWLTESEVAEVLGAPVKYWMGSGKDCKAVTERGPSVEFEVSDDASGFYSFTTTPGAEMLGDVGDRAVWNPRDGRLYVVKDKRMLRVTVADQSLQPHDLKSRAVLVAQKIAARM